MRFIVLGSIFFSFLAGLTAVSGSAPHTAVHDQAALLTTFTPSTVEPTNTPLPPTPTNTPLPTNTATPFPTVTPTPTPETAVYMIDLPSGQRGQVAISMTAGDVGIIVALAAVFVVNLYSVMRSVSRGARAK